MRIHFALIIFLLLGAVLITGSVPAQQFDPKLRRELETIYSDWRKSLIGKDIKTWSAKTARYRQMEVRNQMVSQKRAFPTALFQIPMSPPSLVPLQFADLRQEGDLAQICYFGKVDFGLGVNDIPENLLILKFIREKGEWKYDNARFYNLEGQDELRKSFRGKNYGFLRRDEFNLPEEVPTMAKPVRKPDHVGQVHLLAIGCEAKVSMGDLTILEATDTQTANLVLGGLMSGPNQIKIETTELPGTSETEQKLAVVVFAMPESRAKKPVEVFRYEPEKLPGKHEARILIDPNRLR